MTDFVQGIAREHGDTLVIDRDSNLATGRPLVVEFNDLPNSGLYSCDVWSLYDALVTARDRGYNPPEKIQYTVTKV